MEPNTPANEEVPIGAEEARSDKPLGHKQHQDGDLHLIGESLPESTRIVSFGGVSALGTSPTPAREDHVHGLDAGLSLNPSFPIIYFDPDTYIYFDGTKIQLVVNGVVSSYAVGNAGLFPNGTVGAPSIAFLGEPATGLFRDTGSVLSFAVAGVNVADLTTIGLYVKNMYTGLWTANNSYDSVEGNKGYLLLGNAVADPSIYLRAPGGNVNVGSSGGVDRLTVHGSGVSVTGTLDSTQIIQAGAISTGSTIHASGNIDSNGNVYAKAGGVLLGGWNADAGHDAVQGSHAYILLGRPDGANNGLYMRGDSAVAIGGYGVDCITISSGPYTNINSYLNYASHPSYGSGFYCIFDPTYGTTIGAFTSKREIKDRIESFTDSGPIIDGLRPVTFIEREKEEETEKGTVWREANYIHGFIAEEVAEVAPHIAQWEFLEDEAGEEGNRDKMQPHSWNIHAMVSVLVAEVKSLRARVEELENA